LSGTCTLGDSIGSFFLGPFTIDESKLTTATFSAVNLSKEDDPEKKAAGLALAIDGGLIALMGGSVALAGEITNVALAKISGAIAGLVGGARDDWWTDRWGFGPEL
jgi:hypothetical protein